jgi:hypothetical protein
MSSIMHVILVKFDIYIYSTPINEERNESGIIL